MPGELEGRHSLFVLNKPGLLEKGLSLATPVSAGLLKDNAAVWVCSHSLPGKLLTHVKLLKCRCLQIYVLSAHWPVLERIRAKPVLLCPAQFNILPLCDFQILQQPRRDTLCRDWFPALQVAKLPSPQTPELPKAPQQVPLNVPSLFAPILTFRFPPVAKILKLYASHSCSSKRFPISLVQIQLCIDWRQFPSSRKLLSITHLKGIGDKTTHK